MKKIITAAILCAFSYANGVWAAGLAPEDFNRMYRLAQKGDVYALRSAVQRGLNIDTVNARGNTGLCIAIYRHEQRAYNTFRAAGANPRHPCTQMIPAETYDEFMSSSSVIAIDETPRAAYNVIHSGFLWSPKFWTIAGLGAVGIAALALSGGGGGGGHGGSTPVVPVNYKNLATKAGTFLYTVSETVPAEGEGGTETTVVSKKNLVYLEQSRKAGNLVNITSLDYVTWADELMEATTANYDVYADPLLLADELKVSNKIIGGLQGVLVADGDVVGGQVGIATHGWYTDGTRSGVENSANLNITAPNAAIGIAVSSTAKANNKGTITLAQEESNKTDAYMDTIIGMYGDTGASLKNSNAINGSGAASGNNTIIGMMLAEIGNLTALPPGYSSIIAEAINNGSITMTSANNATNMVGMGSYLPSAYYDIVDSLASQTLTNTGTIYIQYTGDTINGALFYGLGLRGGIGMRADYNTIATNKNDISVTGGDGQATAMLAVNGGSIINEKGAKINVGDFNTGSSSSSSSEGEPTEVDTTSLGKIYGMSSLQGNITKTNTITNDGTINLYADNASAVLLGTKHSKVKLDENSQINIFGNNQAVIENAGADAIENTITINGKIQTADPTEFAVNGDYSDTYVVKGKIDRVDNYATIDIREKSEKQEGEGGEEITVTLRMNMDLVDDAFIDNGGIFYNYGTINWNGRPAGLYYNGSERDYFINMANFVNEDNATLNIKELNNSFGNDYDGLYGTNISDYTLKGTITASDGLGRLVYINNRDTDAANNSTITNNATISSKSDSNAVYLNYVTNFVNNKGATVYGTSGGITATRTISENTTIDNAGVIRASNYAGGTGAHAAIYVYSVAPIINNSNIIYALDHGIYNVAGTVGTSVISNTGIIKSSMANAINIHTTTSQKICNGGTFDANGNCVKADMTADNADYKAITGSDLPLPQSVDGAVGTSPIATMQGDLGTGTGAIVASYAASGNITNYGYIHGHNAITLKDVSAYTIDNYATIYAIDTAGSGGAIYINPTSTSISPAIRINNGAADIDNSNVSITSISYPIFIRNTPTMSLQIENYGLIKGLSPVYASNTSTISNFILENHGTMQTKGISNIFLYSSAINLNKISNYAYINNYGTIKSNEGISSSYGMNNAITIIDASTANNINIGNTGTIEAGAGYSTGSGTIYYSGIYIPYSKDVYIYNGGTYNVDSGWEKDEEHATSSKITGAHAINLLNSNRVTIVNYGTIEAKIGSSVAPGTYFYPAIYISNNGTNPITIDNYGLISGNDGIDPSGGIVISSSSSRGYSITNHENATISDYSSYGIYLRSTTSGSYGTITNDGLIRSSLDGIKIFDDGGIGTTNVTNNGTIESDFGNGISFYDYTHGNITNNGSIDTYNNGIYVYALAYTSTSSTLKNTITNTGSIKTPHNTTNRIGIKYEVGTSALPSKLAVDISSKGESSTNRANIGEYNDPVDCGIYVKNPSSDTAMSSISIVNDTNSEIYANNYGIYLSTYTDPSLANTNIKVVNNGNIYIVDNGIGIYSNANSPAYISNAGPMGVVNYGNITLNSHYATGVKIEATRANGPSSDVFKNYGTINVGNNISGYHSLTGVYLTPASAGEHAAMGMTNYGTINIYAAAGPSNVGVLIKENGTSDNIVAENKSIINLEGSQTIGMKGGSIESSGGGTSTYYTGGTIKNSGTINVKSSANSIGMQAVYFSVAENTGTINIRGESSSRTSFSSSSNVGMYAAGNGTSIYNKTGGRIVVDGKYNAGMYGKSITASNEGTITVKGEHNYGMYLEDISTESVISGTINVNGRFNSGVFINQTTNDVNTKHESTATVIVDGTINDGFYINNTGNNSSLSLTNKGTIYITGTGSIGMFSEGTEAIVRNDETGVINVIGAYSTGMKTSGYNANAINKGTIHVYAEGGAGMEATNNAVATNNGTIIVHSNSGNKYAMYADDYGIVRNDGEIYVYGSNNYAMAAVDSSRAINDRYRTFYNTGDGRIFIAGSNNIAMSIDTSSTGELAYDTYTMSDNAYIAVSGSDYSRDNIFIGNIMNAGLYPIYINDSLYPVPEETNPTPPSPPIATQAMMMSASPKMMVYSAPQAQVSALQSMVLSATDDDDNTDADTTLSQDEPVVSTKGGASNAIALGNGASFINNGMIATDEDLNVDDWKQGNNATVEITQDSVYAAKSLKGTFTANASIVQSPVNARAYATTSSLIGQDNGIQADSGSYLFSAGLLRNASAPAVTGILMTMRDFNEVMDDESLGNWLNTNYDNNNRVDMFNRLKAARTQNEYEAVVNEELALDFVPTIAKQNMDFIRDTGTQLNDDLFEALKNKKRENMFVGVNYYHHRNSSYDSLMSYDSDGENVYGLYAEDFGNHLGVGFGFGLADLHSDYDDDSSSHQNIAQLYIPVSFTADDMAFVSMPKFGAGYGSYKRKVEGDKAYKADLTSYYYGLSNQLRKTFEVEGFSIEPVVEFNVNAMYLDKVKEKDNLFIKSQNSVSVEGGLGLYIGKSIEFVNSSVLNLRLGGTYYREFENPYQRISAGFVDADGYYNMHGYKNGKDRAVISLKADYGLEHFNVYFKAAEYLERSSNFSLQAGMKYNFK